MKKNTLFPTLALVILIIASAYQHAKGQVTGVWSGTASLVQTTIWMGGFKRVKKVNVSFTDNMGSGSVIDNGKSDQGDTECKGSGKAELQHLSINLGDSTYTIHIQSPPCNGSSSTYTPGKRAPYGPEITDLVISDKPWKNPNILSGTQTTVIDLGGGYNTTTTITWTLARGPLDAQLIITPSDYNIWMPKATPDEFRKGSVMDINLKVQGRNGSNSSLKAVRFELKLLNTSREPGTTLNTPLNPSANQLPDIRLLPHAIGESIEEDQYIEINSADGKTGTATIASYDGGGWTTLTAVAVLEGGFRIEGTLLTPAGVKEIPIPKRDPGSNIAKAWLAANGNPGEKDDKESKTGNPNIGDGLTAYEEYRGVISQGQFLRLKAKDKELGVMVKRAEANLFDEGIKWLENASSLKVIRFDETEIGTDRSLNKNFLTSHDFDQYVLKIEIGPTSKHTAGENRPVTLDFMLPKQSELVVINVAWIDQFYPLQESAARAEGINMPYTKNELLASTVAHEIAHGVYVNHHGTASTSIQNRIAYGDSYPLYHIFAPPPPGGSGAEIPVSQWPYDNVINKRYYNLDGITGEAGNEESGDLSCFMAYTSNYQWAFRISNTDRSLYYYRVPLLPIGKKLCTAKTGTGINRPANVGVNGVNKYFGDAPVGADKGNCLNQIKLRD